MGGGELFDHLADLSVYDESQAIAAMLDILRAISHLHTHGIVHRDIKAENLLYADATFQHLKIGDLGSAAFLPPGRSIGDGQLVGTAEYMAPELMRGLQYGHEVDVYSAGVVLYLMLSGCLPYDHDEDADFTQAKSLLDKVTRGALVLSGLCWDEIHSDAKDLVAKMLDTEPSQRIPVAEALVHPWIQSQTALHIPLEVTQAQIRRFNRNRRHVRAASKVVLAVHRMVGHFSGTRLAQ